MLNLTKLSHESLSRRPSHQHTHTHTHTLPYTLTDVGHLGYGGSERAVGEGRCVVVHILNLDDELGLGLHGVVRDAVDGSSVEDVVVLLLTVQALGGVNVSCRLINGEDGASAFS